MGVAYHLSEDYEKAVEHYQAALKENPKSEEVLSNLASVYTKQEKYEDAARIFRDLLKLNPESTAAHEGVGYACYRQEKYDEAREHYEALISVTTDSYEGWYLNYALRVQLRRAEPPGTIGGPPKTWVKR